MPHPILPSALLNRYLDATLKIENADLFDSFMRYLLAWEPEQSQARPYDRASNARYWPDCITLAHLPYLIAAILDYNLDPAPFLAAVANQALADGRRFHRAANGT